MNILAELLEWKQFDVEFLEDIVKEYKIDPTDIITDVKDRFESEGLLDINAVIYTVFSLAAQNFLEAVAMYDKDVANNYEIVIYTNYLDSGFDCSLAYYDIMDFTVENVLEFIKNEKEE
jgi:hypothetical protein